MRKMHGKVKVQAILEYHAFSLFSNWLIGPRPLKPAKELAPSVSPSEL